MNKIVWFGVLWLAVLVAYVMMGFMMPVTNELVNIASNEMASQNLTGIVGVEEAVGSFPYWSWVVPGLAGIVITVIFLKKGVPGSSAP